jgi:hypothetical protein
MWGGVAVMAITGILLVVGEPEREFGALSFWIKMTLVLIEVIGTALLGRTLLRPAARAEGGSRFSGAAKAGAIALMVLWLAVIFLGRAIAYDQEVWGSLSLHA